MIQRQQEKSETLVDSIREFLFNKSLNFDPLWEAEFCSTLRIMDNKTLTIFLVMFHMQVLATYILFVY